MNKYLSLLPLVLLAGCGDRHDAYASSGQKPQTTTTTTQTPTTAPGTNIRSGASAPRTTPPSDTSKLPHDSTTPGSTIDAPIVREPVMPTPDPMDPSATPTKEDKPTNSPVATPADENLRAKIRNLIAEDPQLSLQARTVQVSVSAAQVTLTGRVPTEEERTRLEQIARDCPGTAGVDDKIEIAPN